MTRRSARSPWPQWTTAAAGGLLLVSGLLQLVVAARLTLPVTDSVVIPLAVPAVSVLAAAARAAAFTVAAVGLHGEIPLAGASGPGRVALVVWGLRDLGLLVLAMPIPLAGGASSADGAAVAALELEVVSAVAAVVAALAVARGRVLAGRVRWALLPLAIVEGLSAALLGVPLLGPGPALRVTLVLAAWPTALVEPLLTTAVATSLITWGRLEALKHRARTMYDAW